MIINKHSIIKTLNYSKIMICKVLTRKSINYGVLSLSFFSFFFQTRAYYIYGFIILLPTKQVFFHWSLTPSLLSFPGLFWVFSSILIFPSLYSFDSSSHLHSTSPFLRTPISNDHFHVSQFFHPSIKIQVFVYRLVFFHFNSNGPIGRENPLNNKLFSCKHLVCSFNRDSVIPLYLEVKENCTRLIF